MHDDLEVTTMIRTAMKLAGDGVKEPYRRITQYWNMQGELVIEHDPYTEKTWPVRSVD